MHTDIDTIAYGLAVASRHSSSFPLGYREVAFKELCFRKRYLTVDEITALGEPLTALVLESREHLFAEMLNKPSVDEKTIARFTARVPKL